MAKIQGYTAAQNRSDIAFKGRRSVVKEAMHILNGQTKIAAKDFNKVLKEKSKPDEFDRLVTELEKPVEKNLDSVSIPKNNKKDPDAIIIFRDQVVSSNKVDDKSNKPNSLVKRFISFFDKTLVEPFFKQHNK